MTAFSNWKLTNPFQVKHFDYLVMKSYNFHKYMHCWGYKQALYTMCIYMYIIGCCQTWVLSDKVSVPPPL